MITIEIIFFKKNLEEKKGLVYENIVNLCDNFYFYLFGSEADMVRITSQHLDDYTN